MVHPEIKPKRLKNFTKRDSYLIKKIKRNASFKKQKITLTPGNFSPRDTVLSTSFMNLNFTNTMYDKQGIPISSQTLFPAFTTKKKLKEITFENRSPPLPENEPIEIPSNIDARNAILETQQQPMSHLDSPISVP